jgi:hypothetical protein
MNLPALKAKLDPRNTSNLTTKDTKDTKEGRKIGFRLIGPVRFFV